MSRGLWWGSHATRRRGAFHFLYKRPNQRLALVGPWEGALGTSPHRIKDDIGASLEETGILACSKDKED